VLVIVVMFMFSLRVIVVIVSVFLMWCLLNRLSCIGVEFLGVISVNDVRVLVFSVMLFACILLFVDWLMSIVRVDVILRMVCMCGSSSFSTVSFCVFSVCMSLDLVLVIVLIELNLFRCVLSTLSIIEMCG